MPRTRLESALVAPGVDQGRYDAHHYDYNQQPGQDSECLSTACVQTMAVRHHRYVLKPLYRAPGCYRHRVQEATRPVSQKGEA